MPRPDPRLVTLTIDDKPVSARDVSVDVLDRIVD